MDLRAWIADQDGIVRREQVRLAGYRGSDIARAALRSVGRQWLALDSAPPALVAAALARSRLACVSAAEHHGLSLLQSPEVPHFWAPPHARVPTALRARQHRSRPLLAPRPEQLVESLPDLLQHVAGCLPHVEALVVWESALRRRLITVGALRRVAWRSATARALASEADSASDSLLETILADALRHLGIPFRQQVRVIAHPVDFVIGMRLVVQLDGHEFHAGRAQRAVDAEHDARLQLEGWRTLRFTYEDVTGRLPHVLDLIRRCLVPGAAHCGGGRLKY